MHGVGIGIVKIRWAVSFGLGPSSGNPLECLHNPATQSPTDLLPGPCPRVPFQTGCARPLSSVHKNKGEVSQRVQEIWTDLSMLSLAE